MDPELHGLGDELLKKFEATEQALLTVRCHRPLCRTHTLAGVARAEWAHT